MMVWSTLRGWGGVGGLGGGGGGGGGGHGRLKEGGRELGLSM